MFVAANQPPNLNQPWLQPNPENNERVCHWRTVAGAFLCTATTFGFGSIGGVYACGGAPTSTQNLLHHPNIPTLCSVGVIGGLVAGILFTAGLSFCYNRTQIEEE